MPDPKLQPIINEIRDLLKKHDLVGIVAVQSPTHLQFLIHLQATWTALVDEPRGVRLRCRKADYPNKEDFQKALSLSLGVLLANINALRRLADDLEKLAKSAAALQGEVTHIERRERLP